MSARHKPVACAVIALGVFASVAAGPASAATPAPRQASLSAVGGMEFKVNRYVADTMRFNKDRLTIRSGGTLTVRNRTEAPHTLSLVKRRQLPRSFAQMEKCFGEGGTCATIAAGHGVTGPESEPTNPLVQAGGAGFDVAGDSAVFSEDPLRLKITAAKGRNLHYFCLIHPWMQGRIAVR